MRVCAILLLIKNRMKYGDSLVLLRTEVENSEFGLRSRNACLVLIVCVCECISANLDGEN